MAIKLSPYRFSNKISKLVSLNSYLSSLACPKNPQTSTEFDHDPPNLSDFEGNVRFLKNNLNPDNLIRTLDSTNDLDFSLKLFNWASVQRKFQHTAETYYQMILKLGMAGDVSRMKGFCKSWVNERYPGYEQVILALLDSFVKNRMLNEANIVVDALSGCDFKLPVSVFNALLNAILEEKGDLKDTLFVYKEMVKVGVTPNIHTLNCLMEALFDSNRVDSALDQYKRMRNKACYPNSKTYEIVISKLYAAQRFDKVLVVLQEIFETGFQPELSFYTRIIPLFCKIKWVVEANRLYKLMRSSEIVPNSLIYDVLVQSLCENRCVDEAVRLVDEMKDLNVEHFDDLFADVVNGFCELGKFDEAKVFLQERLDFETSSCNALLRGYCNSSKFLEVNNLLGKMVEKNITDRISWNIVIRFFSTHENFDKALIYFGKMIVSSFIPDSFTYSTLIIGTCKLRKVEAAIDLFGKVSLENWVLDSVSYAELIESLCKSEKIQEAVEVFHYMHSKKCVIYSSSFEMLITGLCEAGDIDTAIRVFWSFTDSVSAFSHLSYKNIVLALLKSSRFHEILIILSRKMVLGCPFDTETYCMLIQIKISLEKTEDCVKYFNLMASKNFIPDSETLTNLLLFLEKTLQLHKILYAIDKFLLIYEIFTPEIYSLVVNGLWTEDKKIEARRLLDFMLDNGWVPNPTTHSLLTGSNFGEKSGDDKFDFEDNVSSILIEGLEKA